MTLNPSKPVNALARGIAILRYLNAQGEPTGVIQIARDLKINPSTCFNLLRTLANERLAVFDPSTKKYASGLGILELASGVLKQGGYARLIHPKLKTIADEYAVTVMLWQLVSPSRVLLIDLAEAPVPVRLHMTVGQRLPSLIGALGRCFAAFGGLAKDRIHAMFKELRWQDPPTFNEYWADVEETRRLGYAVDSRRFNKNFTTVATPIVGRDGRAAMAISVIIFANDFDAKRLRQLAESMRTVTDEASRALGSATAVIEGPANGSAPRRTASGGRAKALR
jgi:DNA-binding IclR family transcriptional regulator